MNLAIFGLGDLQHVTDATFYDNLYFGIKFLWKNGCRQYAFYWNTHFEAIFNNFFTLKMPLFKLCVR